MILYQPKEIAWQKKQARTQDFAQEGATCSRKGPQVTRGPPRRLGAPRRSGTPGYQGPLGGQGPRKPGALGCMQGPIGSLGGPSGNQGHMSETLISIFIPSKRFAQC